jgi:hypothetical protein
MWGELDLHANEHAGLDDRSADREEFGEGDLVEISRQFVRPMGNSFRGEELETRLSHHQRQTAAAGQIHRRETSYKRSPRDASHFAQPPVPLSWT